MFYRKNKSANLGKTKRTTDVMIEEAIARQNSWLERRRAFAKRFLKRLNLFAQPNPKKEVGRPAVTKAVMKKAEVKEKKIRKPMTGLRAYWFPILCAALVIMIAMWVAFVRPTASTTERVVVVPGIPEPIVQVINEDTIPTFDIVRIEQGGNIVIAGRWLPNEKISIVINKKIIATERTNSRGEFTYAPTRAFKSGNYTISMLGGDAGIKSQDNVFIYVSPHGFENSVSLLMTKDGSTLLQSPKLVDGDLSVSKIDYLENGRIVVTGNALPRLRVSLTLNDKYLGFARVSDHKHFGLGADVEKLQPGTEYKLDVRLHDGDGNTVSIVTHEFVMPKMTGTDDTFYTVRRGDCLWIIAKNFLRRGVLFTIIAEKNEIKNPDLIFPNQVLQIPVTKK